MKQPSQRITRHLRNPAAARWLLVGAAAAAVLLVLPADLLAQAPGGAGDGGGGAGGANNGWWNGHDPGPFAGGVIRRAYCDLVELIEGTFGALLMTAAGVLAIATAAFGDLKNAKSAIVVAIGAFTISAGVSLHFGQLCGGGGGGGGGGEGGRTLQPGLQAGRIDPAALAIAAGEEVDFSQAETNADDEERDSADPFDDF